MDYESLMKVSREKGNLARNVLAECPKPQTKEQLIGHLRSWFVTSGEQEFAEAEQQGLIKKQGKHASGEDLYVPA